MTPVLFSTLVVDLQPAISFALIQTELCFIPADLVMTLPTARPTAQFCITISSFFLSSDCTRITSSHCRKTSSMSMHLHDQPRTCTRIHPHTDRCTPKAKERFIRASARGHTRTYMLAACRLHALVLSFALADRLVLSPLLATLCFQHQLCTCIFAWSWSFP